MQLCEKFISSVKKISPHRFCCRFKLIMQIHNRKLLGLKVWASCIATLSTIDRQFWSTKYHQNVANVAAPSLAVYWLAVQCGFIATWTGHIRCALSNSAIVVTSSGPHALVVILDIGHPLGLGRWWFEGMCILHLLKSYSYQLNVPYSFYK